MDITFHLVYNYLFIDFFIEIKPIYSHTLKNASE